MPLDTDGGLEYRSQILSLQALLSTGTVYHQVPGTRLAQGEGGATLCLKTLKYLQELFSCGRDNLEPASGNAELTLKTCNMKKGNT
jgi:hypothetical protein